MKPNTQVEKLRVVVRKDLHPSYQAVQAAHAGIQFQHEYPEIAKHWHETSNYLVNLSANDEDHLNRLIDKAYSKDIKVSIFREPDIDNQITAVAFEPSDESRRMLSHLDLSLKNN